VLGRHLLTSESCMSDDQAMNMPGQIGWPRLGRDTAQTAASDTAPASRRGSTVSSVNQRSKAALKQLSLRIDDGTHSKISQAAQKADKSINAWMEEVLSEAADDTLGSEGEGAIDSDAIRYLIEDAQYSKKLIEAIAPYLKDNSFAAIFQFSHPLRKLLMGWDRIKPLLQELPDLRLKSTQPPVSPPVPLPAPQPEFQPELQPELQPEAQLGLQSGVAKLTDAVLPCLSSADPVVAIQFSRALKKFLLGLAAVKPFMKEGNHSLLSIVMIIEALVHEIETGALG
jgi:hypothetical protein